MKQNYELTEKLLHYNVRAEHIQSIRGFVEAKDKESVNNKHSALHRMEIEDEIKNWLKQNGIPGNQQLCETFAEAGITGNDMENIRANVNKNAFIQVLDWLENLLSSQRVLKDLEEASARISNLVGAVKSHVQMDRTNELQLTNIHTDIENTLTLLGYKLREKNIKVKKIFSGNFHEIPAYVGELNQVWTNIIDNAIYALEKNGELIIETAFDIKNVNYLLKPWSPPEEKLYPVMNDLLDEWQALYKPEREGIRIIGFQWSPKSHRLKEFLSGNLIPFLWMDFEKNKDVEKYLISANVSQTALPLVIMKDGSFMTDPSLPELAGRIGLQQSASKNIYDVLIIGAGPAGLAASVYGSCEGLKTILIEKSNPGGQASSSARIENYLGFPTGLSGAELTRRAIAQTLRFGTEILTPKEVKKIRLQDGYKIIEMTDGSEVHSKSVIIATGVEYTKLEIPGLDNFTGAGVYYGSASVEAHACKDEIVYIVGGGNSACQAAMHISNFAKEVNILIRSDALKNTAANYLAENIIKTPNIKVLPNTEVASATGDKILEKITLKNTKTGNENNVPAKALFIYIGAKPGTKWLNDIVLKDEKGFIITGSELMKQKSFHPVWKLEREPFISETSVPGIFASGDVRFTALTGISSAVGEGAMAIRFVRKYLNEM